MTDYKDDHFWPLILLLLMWETEAELGGLFCFLSNSNTQGQVRFNLRGMAALLARSVKVGN